MGLHSRILVDMNHGHLEAVSRESLKIAEIFSHTYIYISFCGAIDYISWSKVTVGSY